MELTREETCAIELIKQAQPETKEDHRALILRIDDEISKIQLDQTDTKMV